MISEAENKVYLPLILVVQIIRVLPDIHGNQWDLVSFSQRIFSVSWFGDLQSWWGPHQPNPSWTKLRESSINESLAKGLITSKWRGNKGPNFPGRYTTTVGFYAVPVKRMIVALSSIVKKSGIFPLVRVNIKYITTVITTNLDVKYTPCVLQNGDNVCILVGSTSGKGICIADVLKKKGTEI